MRAICACLVQVCLIFMMAAVVHGEELAVSRFKLEGLNGWTPKSFKDQTEYRLQQEDGRIVVQATSHAAASGMVKQLEFDPAKYRYLRWSWKIADTVKGGDEKTKAGDDYAARLYVVFPGLFFWQTKAINYIWANKLPKGETIPNAFTANAMMVAVESGPSLAGWWLQEERDILADYKQLFGEDPPEAGAVAMMTDTDNTGASAVAWYGDIVISTSPR
ncbi:MAG: hypothetical protein ACD_75C02333G0002 [uncultured bacterium]|nr:MAG: hypothetical protein ACD_75C02333G0002 [uncultured bacterium]